jgi:hypothetical protein
MPPDGAGTLPAEEYADLTAFILSQNNVSASPTDLPTDPQKQNAMIIPASK